MPYTILIAESIYLFTGLNTPDMGYSIKEIQDWVGQRDETTTLKIYSKIKSVRSKSSIAERLSGIIKPIKDK